jgi:peptide deformylase
MILPIVKIGNEVLRRKIKNVPSASLNSRAFRSFLKNMVGTMHQAQGVGLAANQVGKALRVFVMECRGNRRYPRVESFPLQVYVNVRIIRRSRTVVNDWEGCLSIPGFRGMVPRARQVTFEALTPEGKKVRRTVKGFEARVVQHEVDHLNGHFYIDRMKDKTTWMHLEEFNRRFKSKVRDNKK